MTDTVGVIGLGIMGGAMARHMAKSGFKVYGFDVSANAAESARLDGIETLASTAAVAEKTQLIICSLPSPLALEVVANEIASSSASGSTVVETSTLRIADKEAARDV
jgi:3-hydroxyisobutyrate dehydrogenase-like beta-hydroxyacid dehydrogenase